MSAHDPTPLDGWVAVVLAAGRGTRMRSNLPKVLHPVAGRPMLRLVCDAAREAGFRNLIVVASEPDGPVAALVGTEARVAVQRSPRGTGDAALSARRAAGEAPRVLIINGDAPMLTAQTLRKLVEHHEQTRAVLTFLTAHLDDPTGYGRVARDRDAVRIVEQSDTDPTTQRLKEVNAGLYAADASWLWPALEALTPAASGEIYLTDLIGRAAEARQRVQWHHVEAAEVHQVNTRAELARAEMMMRERVRQRLMRDGVALIDPPTTYVDVGVEVGRDTTLLPGVHLLGDTRVGDGCRIGPNAVLRNMSIGEGCEIDGSTLEGSTIGDRVTIGPYCHMRPGSRVESDVHLGNYVEVKASRIGTRTQVGHFSYIGDADLGADVNIGAGTVTVNYDGVDKHRTLVGDGAFIGSDSMLVAPIEVGARARTAAGSVVTRDVPPGTLVVGVPARPREQAPGEPRAD